jgi:serine/threonine-protein kinase
MSATAERLSAALADRYRIEHELGQGGMATVYLAEDVKHKRKVALKVLKPELAAVLGADRFVVEIRTTAALQHPHILPLFDSGEADGFLYYVMPFIDGETLRAKLDRETQLGVDEAVKIATDVADALQYAHEHGVIHRDIKPENILLANGRPMVADFGIALAVSAAAGGRMTETGLSLGTPHYMSPEQATAEKEISARADVYSLGSVLYEMLTGDPPHTGSSAQQIIMKIITEPAAPVTSLRKSVPPNVAAAVSRALEKLPADRFTSAKAFAEALANPGFTALGRGATTTSVPGATSWRRGLYAVLAAGIALTAFAIASKTWRGDQITDGPPMHLRLSLPGQRIAARALERDENSDRPSRTAFVFSPDGKSLVFSGERDGRQQLFLRPLSGETATPIAGTEDSESPFFSPNGLSLGFWSRGRLRRLDLSGGPPIDIASLDRIAGASWSDDRVVVGLDYVGLVVFSVTGAAPPDTVVRGEALLPQFLPGGKSILFTHRRDYDLGGRRVEALSLEGGKRTVVIDDAEDARYVPTGHIVFARDGRMWAAPFDVKQVRVTAAPIMVLDDVMQSHNGTHQGVLTGAMQVAISPVGQVAWITGGITPDRRSTISWFDRQGRATPVAGVGDGAFFIARLSPDEKHIAAFAFGRQPRVAIVDVARGSNQTIRASAAPWVLWSPDGKRIVHSAIVLDSTSLAWTPIDGSKPAEPLAARVRIPDVPAFWSPDGAELFVLPNDRLIGVTLATGASRVVDRLPAGIMWPALSPDGKWLAYSAREAGANEFEVFVQPWPALDRRWKISSGGGVESAWTRSGRELVYRQIVRGAPDSTRVMAAEIGAGAGLSGVPRVLFTAVLPGSNPLRSWDVTADGSRFVIVRYTYVQSPPGDVHLMVNWFPELRRLFDRAGGRP